MLPQGGLKLISSYSSSSEDEDNEDGKHFGSLQPAREALPIPKGILNMFHNTDPEDQSMQNLLEHQGRVRSFAHFPGNWSAHVYIPVDLSSKLEQMMTALLTLLPTSVASQMHLFKPSDLHISLSRTVPIRHYWIEPMVELLRNRTASYCQFSCLLHCPKWYVNEEKTRSFLGLKVSSGEEQLQSLVDTVDSIYREFGLPEFYKAPSFHASVAWCLGDIHSIDCSQKKGSRDPCISEQLDKFAGQVVVRTSNICCKIGNKMFTLPLQ